MGTHMIEKDTEKVPGGKGHQNAAESPNRL
jgi:hypothetical protein